MQAEHSYINNNNNQTTLSVHTIPFLMADFKEINSGEDVEIIGHLYTATGSVNDSSNYGSQYGDSLEN